MLPRLISITVLVLVATGCSILDRPEATAPRAPSPSACPTWTMDPAVVRDEVVDVQILNVPTAIVIELHQRDITTSVAQSWSFQVSTPAEGWTVDVDRIHRGHRTRSVTSLYVEPPEPPMDTDSECSLYASAIVATPCRGLSGVVAPYGDTVQVVVPRGCLGNSEWVRVSAEISDGNHDTYSTPELGPRVPLS